MRTHFLKSISTCVFVLTAFMMLHAQGNSAYTSIRNTNLQIKGSLDNMPIAWTTETVDIKLNKETGEFVFNILVDDLDYATKNPDFEGATGENEGKSLTLTGIIPVNDVLTNTNNAIDRPVELRAQFNGLDYHAPFVFTILKFQNSGFSVMARGTISYRALGITNLGQLDDELIIILSFTGA